jgi:hypothetical protein
VTKFTLGAIAPGSEDLVKGEPWVLTVGIGSWNNSSKLCTR